MNIRGFNKAKLTERLEWERHSRLLSSVRTRPCIFLSHKHEDKPACREIATYLKKAQIDYYLDEEDANLQSAVQQKDPNKITECIKIGIRNSTHMLCVVSESTYQSNWVPFEVGYGHAAIIDRSNSNAANTKKIHLSILTLKDLSKRSLPEYMHVAYLIKGIKSLNEYIAQLTGKTKPQLLNERRIEEVYSQYSSHPLDNIMSKTL